MPRKENQESEYASGLTAPSFRTSLHESVYTYAMDELGKNELVASVILFDENQEI